MNRCDARLLSSYLDGELPLPIWREVDGHLRVCQACRRELRSLKCVDEAISSLTNAPEPVPQKTEIRIFDAVERRARSRRRFALCNVTPAAVGSTIAALLVVVSANIGWLYQNSSRPNPSVTVSQPIDQLVARHWSALRNARRIESVAAAYPVASPERIAKYEAMVNAD